MTSAIKAVGGGGDTVMVRVGRGHSDGEGGEGTQ